MDNRASLEGFRQFVLKKYPNMNKNELKAFDDFVTNQQRAELTKKGGMSFQDLVKSDPGSALKLLDEGYQPQPELTAEQKNRQSEFEPAMAAIQNIKSKKFDRSGTFDADIVRGKLNFPLGLGRKFLGKGDQDLVDLNQNFSLLRQQVVRAMQGARMSDADIKQAEQYIPSIQDTPETINTNLRNLEVLLSDRFKKGGRQ